MAAIFLDRDGVLTPKLAVGEYLLHEDQVRLAEGAVDALRDLEDAGHELYVFSNQRCVSRGMISLEEADRLMRLVLAECEQEGVTIRDYRFCPHGNEEGCACRKPEPGMILDLAEVHDLDLSTSVVIGDSETDLEAGRRAGCGGGLYLIDESSFASLREVVNDFLS